MASATAPGHVNALVRDIQPAVAAAKTEGGDPLANAVKAGPVRDLRCTTMRREARFPAAPASDSIGPAIDGCTVLLALASTSQKRALG